MKEDYSCIIKDVLNRDFDSLRKHMAILGHLLPDTDYHVAFAEIIHALAGPDLDDVRYIVFEPNPVKFGFVSTKVTEFVDTLQNSGFHVERANDPVLFRNIRRDNVTHNTGRLIFLATVIDETYIETIDNAIKEQRKNGVYFTNEYLHIFVERMAELTQWHDFTFDSWFDTAIDDIICLQKDGDAARALVSVVFAIAYGELQLIQASLEAIDLQKISGAIDNMVTACDIIYKSLSSNDPPDAGKLTRTITGYEIAIRRCIRIYHGKLLSGVIRPKDKLEPYKPEPDKTIVDFEFKEGIKQ